MRAHHLALVILLSAVPLAACSTSGESTGATFRSALATKTGTVDANEAAALISAYRQGKGLGPVTVDATLMAIARLHSNRMAAADTMTHVLPGEGSFHDRLVAGNYDAGMAAENVAAGQTTLAEVLDAWRKSASHNDNLLEPHVSEIGIAVAIAEGSRYKYYWTLVLGRRRPVGSGDMMNGPVLPTGGVTVEMH